MFAKLVQLEAKLLIRNFVTVLFAFAFPVLMLLMFGGTFGNEPTDLTGGFGAIDIMLPNLMTMIAAVTGLMSLPLVIAEYREQKILKRFMATPLQPRDVLLGQLIVNALATLIGIVLLLIVGKLFYNFRFPGSFFQVALGFILVLTNIFSLGLLIAGVAKTGRSASALAYLIYFPQLFLSGASIPRYIMPKTIVNISKFLPLTYGVSFLEGLWLGKSLGDLTLELAVLLVLSLVFGGLALKFFKWE